MLNKFSAKQKKQEISEGDDYQVILGICGSPRKGNTEWMMKNIFANLPEGELILLRNMNIKFCNGCLICEDSKECVLEDDMPKIYEKLVKCKRIIIGTPVYFDSIPAILKNFIDRLNPLCVTGQLKNKELYLMLVGQLKGEEGEKSKNKVIDYFKGLCEIFGITFCNVWKISAREPEDAYRSPEARKLCEEIRRKVYK
jgi:multimeric flavodoxin WrbA